MKISVDVEPSRIAMCALTFAGIVWLATASLFQYNESQSMRYEAIGKCSPESIAVLNSRNGTVRCVRVTPRVSVQHTPPTKAEAEHE